MTHIMAKRVSGARDGEDWPAVGEPVPTNLGADELEQLVNLGIARKAAPSKAVGEPETAEVGTMPKPETATARPPSSRRRR